MCGLDHTCVGSGRDTIGTVVSSFMRASSLFAMLAVSCALLLVSADAVAQAAAGNQGAAQASEAQVLERARAALDEGKPEQAAPLFREVLKANPSSFEANESLGLIVADAGEYEQALAYFETGCRTAPREALGHANLGATLLALNQDKRAVAELERAAALDPHNAQTAENLARGWMKLKEPARAATQFGAAAALDQPTAELLYNWALALFDSSAFARATEVLSRVAPAEISEESESLFGDAEEKLGHFQSAVSHMRRAAELAPTEPNLYALAVELLRHWSWQQATEICRFARARFPNSDRLSVAQGIALYGNGSYAEAAEVFADLLAAKPDSAVYADTLGRACSLMAEDTHDRCGRLQAFADAHPENAAVNLYAASALLIKPKGEQDLPRAEQLLRTALRSKADHSEALYQLGILYQLELRWPESVDALKKAVALRPAFAEAHYRLARAYFHLGDRPAGESEIGLQKRYQAEEKDALDRRMKSVTLFLFDQP